MTTWTELFTAILNSRRRHSATARRTCCPCSSRPAWWTAGGMGLMIIYRGMYCRAHRRAGGAAERADGKARRAAMPGEFVDDHEALSMENQLRLLHGIHRLPSPRGHAATARSCASASVWSASATACWSSPTCPWSRCTCTPTTPARRIAVRAGAGRAGCHQDRQHVRGAPREQRREKRQAEEARPPS